MLTKYLIKSADHKAVIYWGDDAPSLKAYICKKWGCNPSEIITFLEL